MRHLFVYSLNKHVYTNSYRFIYKYISLYMFILGEVAYVSQWSSGCQHKTLTDHFLELVLYFSISTFFLGSWDKNQAARLLQQSPWPTEPSHRSWRKASGQEWKVILSLVWLKKQQRGKHGHEKQVLPWLAMANSYSLGNTMEVGSSIITEEQEVNLKDD